MDAIGVGFIALALTVLLLFSGVSYLLLFRRNPELRFRTYEYRLLIAGAIPFVISLVSCKIGFSNLHC